MLQIVKKSDLSYLDTRVNKEPYIYCFLTFEISDTGNSALFTFHHLKV